MTNTPLTEQQINLLKLGLKFTPTPTTNHTELMTDMKSFCRRLRLKEEFYDSDDETPTNEKQEGPLVRNKSKHMPKPRRNTMLDDCIDILTRAVKENPTEHKTRHKNLSHQQTKALTELQHNKAIIIKNADKGGAVCVMDKTFYATKINDMLNDDNTYMTIDQKKSNNTITKLKKLILKHKHCLMNQEIDYITNFENKESNLYGLPKIHKSKIINEAIFNQNSECITISNPTDLKFRPIIAGPSSPTSRLSQFIDLILKPIPPKTKSYVRDDIEFLSKLQRNLPADQKYTLVTYDVESLYTNIDHDLGIKAIEYWIDKHPECIDPRFTKEFISESIRFILENNTFHFDNKYFIQTKGTAMGTKMAPTYANLVLAFLEETLYENIRKEHGAEHATFIEMNFLRYIDDCFIIWPHTKYNLKEFTEKLNNMHPNFKFTIENHLEKIPFLDITVQLENNTVTTDIYYKPTDTHLFLPFNSCHPRHTKTSIPYSQARRICTIVDNKDTLMQRLHEMKTFFISRGYPTTLIDDSIKKSLSIPQHILRQTKTKQNEDILPFVFTHNPNNQNLTNEVRHTLDILKLDPRMGKVLHNTKFVPSKRQAPNLARLLTRAKFSYQQEETGSFRCGDKRCGNCKYMNETKTLRITTTNTHFHIKHRLTCKTSNVLYAITCQGCNEQYIGMTNNTLAKRFTIHRQQLNNPIYRQIGVSKHLDECSTKDIKFTVTPFFKITDDKTQGQTKETYFINKFKPSLNMLTLNN